MQYLSSCLNGMNCIIRLEIETEEKLFLRKFIIEISVCVKWVLLEGSTKF